jgi:hypothetical protein
MALNRSWPWRMLAAMNKVEFDIINHTCVS